MASTYNGWVSENSNKGELTMSAAIIKILLPLALWLLTKFFEKDKANAESKKRFLLFIDSVERSQLSSVKLNNADRKQMLELLNARRDLL